MLEVSVSARSLRSWAALMAVAAIASALTAAPALAGPGYELDQADPYIATNGEAPLGVAIDQASQQLYVAELSSNIYSAAKGKVEQFEPNGTASKYSPFVAGTDDLFTGVGVNPVDHSVLAFQTEIRASAGTFGTPHINHFSPTGTLESSFSPPYSPFAQIAIGPTGLIYYPDETTATVQIFDSTGAVKGSIPCTGCPGGAFVEPRSVALDSAGDLYVVDVANGGRAIKFKPAAGSYAYDSTLQSGKGAVGLGVDRVSDDVFVGDLEDGEYHIVAYNSSGTQFDDFGDTLFTGPPVEIQLGGQIAVDETTRKVYVADPGDNKVRIFDRIASIPPPTASTSAPTGVGQVEVTFKAQVNPEGHGLTDCHFEYTTQADYQTNEFANATSVPCSERLGGSVKVTASARVTTLSPSTKYDYQVVVASNGGEEEGAARGFETLPLQAPEATTGSASAITLTGATLGGTVNPRGGLVSDCRFEYATGAAFQEKGFSGAPSVACVSKPSGTAAAAVSAKISSGLSPGTAYRFRVRVTSNAGSDEGSDQAFTTLSETCETNSALCPPPAEPPTFAEPEAQLPPLAPFAPRGSKPLKCRKGFKKKRVHGKLKCVKVKKKRR
jgi:DNA-binding beta-propeller fold protein YncE